MALGPLSKPWHYTAVQDQYNVEFDVTDIPIGGKLMQARLELNQMEQMNFKTDDDYKRAIKQKIAADLARAMIEGNLIEFTHMPQPATGRDTIYARCYLAKDSDVKILRMHYAKPVRP